MESQIEIITHKRKFSPWFLVWICPREVIRNFIDSSEPQKNMILISMIAGIIGALNKASTKSSGDDASLAFILIMAVIVGSIGGIISLYLFSGLFRLTGKWLGGQATRSDLRVAITRGFNAPLILIGLLWIPELVLFGHEMFTSEIPVIESNFLLTILFYVLMIIEFIFGIWLFIIGLKAIGEAHKFSAVKAFLSVIIPYVILFAIFFFII